MRRQGQVFVIEANPRASRTVPFVAKATGVPLAKVAARVMLGATLARAAGGGPARSRRSTGGHVAVKEAVLPFNRFPEVDTRARPGDALDGRGHGHRPTFGLAFAKSRDRRRHRRCRRAGTVFLSLADRDKAAGVVVGAAGFASSASRSPPPRAPPAFLERFGVPVDRVVAKVGEGTGVTAVDLIAGGEIDLVVNTPAGQRAAGRRRPHPPGRGRAPHQLRHHGRRRRSPRRRAWRSWRPTTSRSAPSRSTTAGEVAPAGARRPFG